jgi:hypothetical protein
LKTDPNPRLASLRGRLAAEIAAMEQREQDRNHRALRTSEQDRIRRALRTQQAATPPPAQPPSTDLSPASWPTPPPPTSITTRIAKISSSGIQAARSEPIAPCVEDECAQLVALARRCTAAGQRFPAIHAAAEGALKAAARIMIAIEARWPNRPPEADEPTHVD